MERLTIRDAEGTYFITPMGNALSAPELRLATVQVLIDRLAAYEDAEEQSLLVRLPCKVGSHVWRVWITEGRKPEITEHYMSDLLHIVQWIGKFGKTVFLTREEAEAALAKDTNVSSKGE